MGKLKASFSGFWKSLFNNNVYSKEKRTKTLSLVIFWFAFFSIVMALIGQFPYFTERGVRILFQFGFILILIPMTMLDYKHLLRCLVNCLIIILPFVVYLLIAFFSGVNSLYYSGTRSIVVAMYVLFLGMFLGKYFSPELFNGLGLAYIIGAAIYASIVFFFRLKGYDIESSIYAFDDKNSAGPIFFSAALLAFIVFKKKGVFSMIVKVLIFSFFSFITIIAKCRATIVYIPIALLVIHFFLIKNKTGKLISRIGFPILIVGAALIIWFVPSLHKRIIVDIMMNGKKTIQEAFSGRIEKILDAFNQFKVILGNGGQYIDCMPVSFLVSYGVVGFVLLLPTTIIPFMALIRSRKLINNKTLYVIQLTILGLLVFNSAFEGYGYYGPGTKVFALWLLCGYSYAQLVAERKAIIKQIDAPATICEKIKPKPFLIGLEIVLIGASCFVAFSKSTASDYGEKLASLLPSSEYKAEYNIVSKAKIDKDLRWYLSCRGETQKGDDKDKKGKPTMCVGQKLKLQTYYTSFDGKGAPTDCWSDWQKQSWWHPERILVNNDTKEMTALQNTQKSTTIVQTILPNSNGDYIEFKICNPSEYEFKNASISTVPVEGEVKNRVCPYKTTNEKISLNPNDSFRFYYDEDYIPSDPDVHFEFFINDGTHTKPKYVEENEIGSINPSTGVFKAKQQGDCEVIGKVTGGKAGVYKTQNSITVNITGEKQKADVTELDFKIPEKENGLYQHLPFEIVTTLKTKDNTLPPDEACDVLVEKIEENGSKVLCKKAIENTNSLKLTIDDVGSYDITVTSRNNTKLSKKQRINIQENKPIKLKFDQSVNKNVVLKSVPERLWLNIRSNNLNDYEKTIEDLGIVLEFEHGSKEITDNDLLIQSVRSYDRATSNRSGVISKYGKEKIYFRGVKKGLFSHKLICAYDKNISLTVNFTSSVYEYNYYQNLKMTLGLIVIYLLLILFSIFLLFVDFKYKLTYILIALLNIACVVGISLYVYLTITSNIVIYVLVYVGIVFVLSLFRLIARNNRAIKFVNSKTTPITK